MRILIVGINYSPEQAGIAVYTSGFAEDLVRRGHEVTVICAPPHFPSWRVAEGYSARRYRRSVENGVEVIRCPTYVPRSTGAAKRIVHYLSFAFSSFPAALRSALRRRPDIVFCVAPALLSSVTGLMVAKLARAATWLHVQDLEIEAAFASGVLKPGPAARVAKRVEAFLLKRFDRVSTISPQMLARIAAKGVPQDRLTEFRNWSNLDEIVPLSRPSRYREWWNIEAEHVALYSGSIGNKQGIEIVVEAARRLQHRRDLVFVICGDGPNLPRLRTQAAGLANVQFQGLQPRDQLNELLGLATIHLLPQVSDAADTVLPSKLTNMLASGRPVIATALPGTGLHREVATCGLTPPPGDVEALVDSIAELIGNPPRRAALGACARARAESTIGGQAVLGRIAALIRQACPQAS
jgi:colanic acid biosynthesis glycosyl transferase WcaI